MQMQFEVGQRYIRRFPLPAPRKLFGRAIIREVGQVREVSPDQIIMDVDGPLPGIETFNPAHNNGWRAPRNV